MENSKELDNIKTDLQRLQRELADFRQSFDQFREFYLGSRQDLWERSRTRWRGDEADTSLTWGSTWTGDAFVKLVERHFQFEAKSLLLEIGPGYGRLLDTIKAHGLRFEKYLGLDISEARVKRLENKYSDDRRILFTVGDVEKFSVPEQFDLCVASATFSHLFPNFAEALSNVRRHLKIGGVLCFDVSEGGSVGGFQQDGATFGRCYNDAELRAIFHDSQFGNLFIDRVTHGNDAVTSEPVTMLFVSVTRLR